MGRPKQLLPWRGTTLLRHAAVIALETACRPIVVVLGAEANACRKELEKLDVAIIENTAWASGMSSSVNVGVRELELIAPETPGVLFMLVDQPGVTPLLLESLLAAWSKDHPIAATRYAEGGGVPAVLDRSFFPELRDLKGDCGARAIVSRNVHKTAFIDGPQLIDLDTPEAYSQHSV